MMKLVLIATLCSLVLAQQEPKTLPLPLPIRGYPSSVYMPQPHQPKVPVDGRNQQKRQADFNPAANPEPNRPKPNGFRQVNPQQQQRRPQFEQPRPQQQFNPQNPKPQQYRQPEPPRFNPNPAAGAKSPAVPSIPDFGPESGEKLERPLRQNPSPVRPAAPAVRDRNPEFANGFPNGFTNGLPSFDFQGRMPEPDSKSEGFMDGALRGFPSLKTFGGFDPLPDVARTEVEEPKLPQPGPQRPLNNRPVQNGRTRRSADSKSTQIDQRLDDEAFLEADEPRPTTKGKTPTDIADIIADSQVSEQRFLPTFQPSNGPFGRHTGRPQPVPRRPLGPVQSFKARPAARSPYIPSYEFTGDNNLLGSGNFEILPGGVYRDASDLYNNYNSYNNHYEAGPAVQTVPDYPTSFFNGDFFSNFRDFADVNQDYRNNRY